jgi:hypothetical protein
MQIEGRWSPMVADGRYGYRAARDVSEDRVGSSKVGV